MFPKRKLLFYKNLIKLHFRGNSNIEIGILLIENGVTCVYIVLYSNTNIDLALFTGISTFEGYLMPKSSLQKNSHGTI